MSGSSPAPGYDLALTWRDGRRETVCCVARPRADCRIEVGAGVRAASAPTPWKTTEEP
ncbi:hypothetical protein [Salinilacihabitans rarus]|uniref:hypothetical protein n=1 Tax=Salinilacihabitans rarus TaxID=2961596 RepID=UPI0020C88681|nr:hypothetical protein [Salinilacihabitans rarus]